VSYFLSLPLCLLCKDSPNVCPLPGAYGWLKSFFPHFRLKKMFWKAHT
jgi:hypothetical protein